VPQVANPQAAQPVSSLIYSERGIGIMSPYSLILCRPILPYSTDYLILRVFTVFFARNAIVFIVVQQKWGRGGGYVANQSRADCRWMWLARPGLCFGCHDLIVRASAN